MEFNVVLKTNDDGEHRDEQRYKGPKIYYGQV